MAGPVTTTCADVVAADRRAGDVQAWPTLAVLGVLWLLNINQLRVEWTVNPQYTYGWTVPFLALYLFSERWKDRPRVGPVLAKPILIGVLAAMALVHLPFRLVAEAAPDWRLINWAMAGSAAVISLGAVYFSGGIAWLRHFGFAVLFVLVAVPWPMPFERALVQNLMQTVAQICVELLSFFSIPAVQHGNVIHIASGKVGVEEACSGVRSLQTTLMAALFLGELFRFSIVRRSLLLGCGLLLAFVCNLGRSFALVWVSVNSGTERALELHDHIGLAVLLTSLGGLALLCALLRPRQSGEIESVPDEKPWQPRFASRPVVIAAAVWIALVELGTEAWYRAHERGPTLPLWSVQFPKGEREFRELPLSETTQAILRYDEGHRAAWEGPGDTKWSMFFLRWKPGRASMQLARSHGPEVCLAAAGARLNQDLGLKMMRVAGVELPMRHYVFTVGSTPLYVFFCMWEDLPPGVQAQSSVQSMTMAGRLRDVREGRRNTGQQVIEVAVAGYPGPASAEAATQELLERIIRR